MLVAEGTKLGRVKSQYTSPGCQKTKENPILPDSFTHIFILFLMVFPIGPPKMHKHFCIGLPKTHIGTTESVLALLICIGPPESVLALLNPYWPF